MVGTQPLQDGWDIKMAKAKAAYSTADSSFYTTGYPRANDASITTPAQKYPQPYEVQGDIYPSSLPSGAMGRSPEPDYLADNRRVTPYNVANQAAMRAYTRNAPYMENLIGDPRAMMSEMKQLQLALSQNPNDPVSEYRLRILRQAMGDVYGIQPNDFIGYLDRPSYPTTGQR